MAHDRQGDAPVPPGASTARRRPTMARLTGAPDDDASVEPPADRPGPGLGALDDFAATVQHTATPAPPSAPTAPAAVPASSVADREADGPADPIAPSSEGGGERSASDAARAHAPPHPEPPSAPAPSGDLAAAVAATGTVVTDLDRNRFGMLLDRALERGLLTPVEYDVRLGRLAEASTVEEMTDIVTDFPAFQAQADALANVGRKGRRATGRLAVPAGALGTTPAPSTRPRVNSWVLLTVVILVLAAATVVLLITMRTVHPHPSGGVVAHAVVSAVVAPAGPAPG